MIEMFLIIVVSLLLVWLLGLYLVCVMCGMLMKVDVLFYWIEKLLYRVFGVDFLCVMFWCGYVLVFVLSNVVVVVLIQVVFMIQVWLLLNLDQILNMCWDIVLYMMILFLININQQYYLGQVQLFYFLQMIGIIGLQVVILMMGLVLVVVMLCVLFLCVLQVVVVIGVGDDCQVVVGNYYVDVVCLCVCFLLLLCLVWILLLISQGVLLMMVGGLQVMLIDVSVGMVVQKLLLGLVVVMVVVKQLGVNGGGWYGLNSSFLLENLILLLNVLEIVGILLVLMVVIFMIGVFIGWCWFGVLVFSCMLGMLLLFIGVMMWSEGYSVSVVMLLLMEGKEVCFGVDGIVLWVVVIMQVFNGLVDGMYDLLVLLSGGIVMVNMLVSVIWGGIGCGLQQFIVYLLLGVFLVGLMIGCMLELFGCKLEMLQVCLLVLLVLLQLIILLVFIVIILVVFGLVGIFNFGFYGISQVFYEYVLVYVNNGLGFEGLGDVMLWWNLSCLLVLLLGCFLLLIILLVVVVQLVVKCQVLEFVGSLQIEILIFVLILVLVIVILIVLQFMLVLVFGLIVDYFSLGLY